VILAAVQGAQYVFTQLAGNGDVQVHPFGLTLEFNGSIGVIAYPLGSALVSGAVVAFVHRREQGKAAGVREDYREIWGKLWRVVGAQLLVYVLLALMFITVIGVPFAIYFYIAWQFVQQEILFENRSIRESLRGSHSRVRGHWWRTVVVTAILALIGVVIGPVLGFFLIFLNLSAVLVNLFGSIVYALVFPYVALGRTLLYLDLCAREEAEEAAGLKRHHWFSRPRPATETA
jgi:membrane-anchored glycerophosphoryl diester phosphodiesterase (GDPDase)